MPPKMDPNEIKYVYVRVTGGEVPGASSLAPKVGPLGMSPKKVGDDIVKATQEWKGLRVTAKLIVQNRQAKVEIVPSAASMIIKALKEPVRDRKKVKNSECREPKHAPCARRCGAPRKRCPPAHQRAMCDPPPARSPRVRGVAVVHSGSITFDDIIRIGRIMAPRSLSKTFTGTCLEMLGTAQSVGCKVDGQDPHDLIEDIKAGEGPEIPDE